MTLTAETGAPTIAYNCDSASGALSVNTVISASGHKIAKVGQIWHPTIKTGTINIRKVHFRCGALTLNAAGGTEVRVSLQNVSTTAGPPYQPDGTQDQFYDFKTATTTLTANTFNATGNLSADRAVDLTAVNIGDTDSRWLAVVWEFNVFSASDSLIVSGYTYTGLTKGPTGGIPLTNTGTWALVSQRLNSIVFECGDGTFAFFLSAVPAITPTTQAVANNLSVRRAGLKFKFPTARTIDRASLGIALPNGCDGRVVLYDSDGTTELASVDLDNDAVQSASTSYLMEVAFAPVALAANTFYRLAFVGTTTTAGSVVGFDVANAGHLDGVYIGQNAHWTQHDGASWTETITRQPFFGLGVYAMHDGGSGGGAIGVIGS